MKAKQYLGGCLCGNIRFRATGEPVNPHACSCANCRRHSGAPLLCWLEFPKESVEWTGDGGEPVLYRSSDFSSRSFCPLCGSTLGAIDDAPAVALVTGSFDDGDDPAFHPLSHSFEDGCPTWCKIAAA